MKFLIFALLVLSVFGKVEYERGTDKTFKWSGQCQHVLQCGTDIGRYADVHIDFATPFSTSPEVVLSYSLIDLQNGPTSFDMTLQSVSTTGFTYRVTVYTERWVGSLHVEWVAVLDSNIRVTYNNQVQLTNVADQSRDLSGNVQVQDSINVQYDTPLNCEDPIASVFLLGGEIVSDVQELCVYVLDWSDPTFAAIEAVGSSSVQNWISFVVVSSCESQMESNYMGDSVANTVGHPWVTGSGSRSVNQIQQLNYPEYMASGFLFFGISGLDLPGQHNMRIVAKNVGVSDGSISMDLGTWSGTVLESFFVDYFTYNPVNQCAIVYDSCDFQGESLQICSGEPVNSFAVKAWGDKEVKSVKVPSGRTLTLFDAENQEGAYTQVTGEVACSSGWVFT